jgi:hypothetical protein
MGKLMSNYGTQVKERARQQKQLDKASKRMFTRQKRAYAKTSAPNADLASAEPISATSIVGSED